MKSITCVIGGVVYFAVCLNLSFAAPLGGLESVSRTVTLDTTMTDPQLQEAIDGVHRYIPEGVTITFQFSNGTYTPSSQLDFQGFYGGGSIAIQGDTSETSATTLHTTQNVHINGSSLSNDVIFVNHNSVEVKIRNLKITVSSSGNYTGVMIKNTNFALVLYNYIVGGSSSTGHGIVVKNGSAAQVEFNYVSNLFGGITAFVTSSIYSRGNDDVGTKPSYGLWADWGGEIAKFVPGTQPSGSSADEAAANGSVIR